MASERAVAIRQDPFIRMERYNIATKNNTLNEGGSVVGSEIRR